MKLKKMFFQYYILVGGSNREMIISNLTRFVRVEDLQ